MALSTKEHDTGGRMVLRILALLSTILSIGVVAVPADVAAPTTPADQSEIRLVEHVISVAEPFSLADVLGKNGVPENAIRSIVSTLLPYLPTLDLPVGTRVRLLLSHSPTAPTGIVQRVSVYLPDPKSGAPTHTVTVTLTDRGIYIIGAPPEPIEFP